MTCAKCVKREKDLEYYKLLNQARIAIELLYEHEYRLIDNYPPFVKDLLSEMREVRGNLLIGEKDADED